MAGRLKQLAQDEVGMLYLDGRRLYRAWPAGKIRTLLVQNPSHNTLEREVADLAINCPHSIPAGANAFISSSFNPDTQHFRNEKGYSVYALQFYFVWDISE